MKQTFGRVSQRGLQVTSNNGDHIGPMTRSVADSAIVLQAIAGYDPLDPSTVPVPVPDFSARLGDSLAGLKMGIPTDYYFDFLDPDTEAAVRGALSALEELGVEVREVSLPSMKYAGALRIAGMADSVVTHEPFLRENRDDYGPTVLYRTLAGQFILGRDYSKAMKVQRIIKEEYAQVLQEVDFLVTPSSPVPAWRIDSETVNIAGEDYPVRGPGAGMTSRCTSPSNATGLPAMSVPCGFSRGGLPIGLQLIGRPFEEPLLYQVAHAYEDVSPSKGRRPAVVNGA
jgi:Asp-tRNA(Asn)/Glu-tRNA(Gln) amidotransferase A subunit family amidase